MPVNFDPNITQILDLPAQESWPETKHRFDPRSVWAVKAAIASGRPLLLRGEPGIGKSQLARAVAVELGVPFLYCVVDERSERDDLLYTYDAVARLAEAQVCGLIAKEDEDWRTKLEERNFIRPGVLWWAFDWSGAEQQAKAFSEHCRRCPAPSVPDGWVPTSDKPCGPVVLIDEIDKADPSVPNGLLESLGNDGFQTAQLGEAVRKPRNAPRPLVIITTNEERELPSAFLRRCLVLQSVFPIQREGVEQFLIRDRARVFWSTAQISDAVCKKVIDDLLEDRTAARRESLAAPGAAEFLDILRVLHELHPSNETAQLEALSQIKDFALKKHLTATS